MFVVYFIYYKEDLLYIGSTENFKRRQNGHRIRCYNEDSKKSDFALYKYIRENNIEFGGLIWKTIAYEYICKDDLLKIENLYIQSCNPKCNVYKAYRTFQDKKNQNSKDDKLYYQRHKPEIQLRNTIYYQNHSEEIKKYEKTRRQTAERKEYMKKYLREYYKKKRANNRNN